MILTKPLHEYGSPSSQLYMWVNTSEWSVSRSVWSPRDFQESYPTPQFKSINSSSLSFLHSPNFTPYRAKEDVKTAEAQVPRELPSWLSQDHPKQRKRTTHSKTYKYTMWLNSGEVSKSWIHYPRWHAMWFAEAGLKAYGQEEKTWWTFRLLRLIWRWDDELPEVTFLESKLK